MHQMLFVLFITCNILGAVATNIHYNLLDDLGFRRFPSPTAQGFFDGFEAGFKDVRDAESTPMRGFGLPGIGLIDFDNDGDVDIYVGNTNGVNNSLYKNQLKETGLLSFVDVAVEAGVTNAAKDGMGICFADIDNDGDDDLVVLNREEAWTLFRNEGDGTFTDISQPDLDFPYSPAGCAFGDIDNDGYVDLYIGNTFDLSDSSPIRIVVHEKSEPNALYLNKGPGHFPIFEDISSRIFHPLSNITWGVGAVDFDLDGDVDLFDSEDEAAIAWVDRGFNRIRTNNGSGFFVDESVPRKMDFSNSNMGLAWGDWNCDGNLDFFSPQVGAFFVWHVNPFPPKAKEDSVWYLGTDDKKFRRPGTGGLGSTPFGWGGVSIDMENDGDQDIIYFGGILNFWFLDNNPGSVLENIDCSANFERAFPIAAGAYSRRVISGTATADLNLDGFPDIVSVSDMDIPEDHQGVNYNSSGATTLESAWNVDYEYFLYFTPSPPFTFVGKVPLPGQLYIEMNSADNANNWVLTKIRGTKDVIPNGQVNRNGIGAVLYFTPEGGKTVMKPVEGGTSHASQDAFLKTWGLGSATKGRLTIFWPKKVMNELEVDAGETVIVPEIPCSFTSFPGDYNGFVACLDAELDALVQVGEIQQDLKDRLRTSNIAAYQRTHQ